MSHTSELMHRTNPRVSLLRKLAAVEMPHVAAPHPAVAPHPAFQAGKAVKSVLPMAGKAATGTGLVGAGYELGHQLEAPSTAPAAPAATAGTAGAAGAAAGGAAPAAPGRDWTNHPVDSFNSMAQEHMPGQVNDFMKNVPGGYAGAVGGVGAAALLYHLLSGGKKRRGQDDEE